MIRNTISKQKEFNYFCASLSVLIDVISPRNGRQKRAAELNYMRERVTNGGKRREAMRRELYCKGNTLGTEKPTFYFACFVPGLLYKYQQITESLCKSETSCASCKLEREKMQRQNRIAPMALLEWDFSYHQQIAPAEDCFYFWG